MTSRHYRRNAHRRVYERTKEEERLKGDRTIVDGDGQDFLRGLLGELIQFFLPNLFDKPDEANIAVRCRCRQEPSQTLRRPRARRAEGHAGAHI